MDTGHISLPRPPAERNRVLNSLHPQVIIIGGGINGIATFRDLALQGVDVLLIEREDFCSGTSSASSRMIHGGIRYLENGEFRLVRESVRERNDLLKTAAHVVKPLKTTIPIFSMFSGLLSAPMRFLAHRQSMHRQRGALLIKVGLTIYDIFSRDNGTIDRHYFRGRKRSLSALPALNPNVKYTANYYDASIHDPERLALDLLIDGESAHRRAFALNYVEAVGLTPGGLIVRDRETNLKFTIRTDLVINTSGPWVDLTNATLGHNTQLLSGTKGSHVVFDNPELLSATGGREIFFEHPDGRIVLIHPVKDRVLVGTTDIPADPQEPAHCTEEEIEYFLDLIGEVFPDIAVQREQIVYRFAGIRPLPNEGEAVPGFISRDYKIERLVEGEQVPVLCLVGGKWTTFRATGEALTNRALDELRLKRGVHTRSLAIGGGKGYPRNPQHQSKWLDQNLPDCERAQVLFERYGTRAVQVAAFIGEAPDTSLLSGELSSRELKWMIQYEHVKHVADVIFRRAGIAFTGNATPHATRLIAEELASILAWDEQRTEEEVASCLATLRYEIPTAS